MTTKNHSIPISLETPWRVADAGASRFAALLLLALAVARRSGEPCVPVYRLHFLGQAGHAFPMALSRAFALFARAGLPVGWGGNLAADVSALSVRGRVHGPFWLTKADAARLQFFVDGKLLTLVQQKKLLARLAGSFQAAGDATADAELEARLDRWMRVFVLRQSAEEGRLSVREVMDGLARVRGGEDGCDASRLWALNLQARYARLARDGDRARALYKSLHQRSRAPIASDADDEFTRRMPVLEAIAEIGLAWCDHQDNRSAAALMRLEQMRDRFEGEVAPLRLSSRLAAEYFNLRALARRALLLGATAQPHGQSAQQVLRDMQLALVCAVETDSLTLMEAVASNLGYSLWLLAPSLQARLGAEAGRRLAVRWILTGEALARRHGLGSGSYWNIIYICRIARGAAVSPDDADACSQIDEATLADWTAGVWSLKGLRADLAQSNGDASDPAQRELRSLCELLLPSSLPDWITLTARMLDAVSEDVDGQTISPVQRCAAMLEHLWQLVLQGRWEAAVELRRHLEAQLTSLEVAQRKYFRADLARLPRV